MTNSGKIDPEQAPVEVGETPRWRRMLWPVLGLIVVLGVGLYIASPVVSILFSIAAPPQPPVPRNVRLLQHENSDHGVDQWLYGVDQDICGLVDFYQQTGAECVVAPRWCGEMPNPNVMPWRDGTLVAVCSQDQDFSIFAMRWNAEIMTGFHGGDQVRLDLFREVSWGGSLPPRETATP